MFVHTIRLAVRSLRRRPGFSAVAIVTIALGAGANAAVSAVAYGILLKPLPFDQPDRLVAVWPGQFMSQVELRYVREHAILYPIAIDNDFATWNRYANRYWPAMYLIDKRGIVRYLRIGEGGYEQTERQIQALLEEISGS